MPRINKATSDKISAISFICTCLVVLIHVPIPSTQLSSGWYLSKFLSYGICLISVPSFFVISGFLLGLHQNETGWWKRETTKRIKSLIIPYLSFNLLYFLWISDFKDLSFSNMMIADNKLLSFLRYTLSIHNIVYFVMGIYLANNSVIQFSRQKYCAMLVCSIIILICKVWTESVGIHVPLIWRLFFCPLLMISLWGLMPMIKLPSCITTLSFPIYLIHYFIISLIIKCNVNTDTSVGFFLSYSIMLLGSAFICAGLRRAMPAPIIKILFGGR